MKCIILYRKSCILNQKTIFLSPERDNLQQVVVQSNISALCSIRHVILVR